MEEATPITSDAIPEIKLTGYANIKFICPHSWRYVDHGRKLPVMSAKRNYAAKIK
jgi:hypothetical protein